METWFIDGARFAGNASENGAAQRRNPVNGWKVLTRKTQPPPGRVYDGSGIAEFNGYSRTAASPGATPRPLAWRSSESDAELDPHGRLPRRGSAPDCLQTDPDRALQVASGAAIWLLGPLSAVQWECGISRMAISSGRYIIRRPVCVLFSFLGSQSMPDDSSLRL